MSKPQAKYLTIKEASLFLGISTGTLRAWDKNKKLKAAQRGRNKYRLYRLADLHRFLENNKVRKYNKTEH